MISFYLSQGTPQVTETFIDSKKEVDAHLKRTCEQFIAIVCDHLLASLKDYLQNVSGSSISVPASVLRVHSDTCISLVDSISTHLSLSNANAPYFDVRG